MKTTFKITRIEATLDGEPGEVSALINQAMGLVFPSLPAPEMERSLPRSGTAEFHAALADRPCDTEPVRQVRKMGRPRKDLLEMPDRIAPAKPAKRGWSAERMARFQAKQAAKNGPAAHETRPRNADSDPIAINPNVIGGGAKIGRPEEPKPARSFHKSQTEQ